MMERSGSTGYRSDNGASKRSGFRLSRNYERRSTKAEISRNAGSRNSPTQGIPEAVNDRIGIEPTATSPKGV